ncbi:uncharacterized protein L969DRAFT_49402 [Mixia osmundae IAM 14324]|uniref:Uncharacterized protein n=1 Tax=Mixia osmundae (strain CBS 9802 / IAM 14324 / JCM 22182 / KY 12970) TaxID=764103 RepID=G7E3K0_MIXOS|nr:uncharacterized protein L969DRAFT_49402 [Mixia osmundae IAM 14324]KEI39395.1 hypothetical protein L969DRAFT_49402 [Mixia osmundae IAM 14324]GAA97410.1 hypothetical protein E5Q_04088 [Mixia osmundae IAM 14324]
MQSRQQTRSIYEDQHTRAMPTPASAFLRIGTPFAAGSSYELNNVLALEQSRNDSYTVDLPMSTPDGSAPYTHQIIADSQTFAAEHAPHDEMVDDGPLYRDPWARRNAWRTHPVFSNRQMFKNLFPGFGIAVVAFAAFVGIDNLIHPSNMEAIRQQAHEATSGPTLMDSIKAAREGKPAKKE